MSIPASAIADALQRILAVGASAVASQYPEGSNERLAAVVAASVIDAVIAQFNAGDTEAEVVAKLKTAPPLRSAMAADLAEVNARIARKPSRNDDPEG